MKGYLDNLRPFEKRVVVGVAVLFILVLNFLFVFPHFSDWGKVQNRMWEAQRKLKVYQNEIAQMPDYERRVKALQSEGLDVPLEDQALHFATAIQAQAGQSRVLITSGSRVTSSTNSPFFLEQSQSISVQAPEQQLVDFLFSLGSGNSLIRVRDLGLRPDPPRQQLVANVKLVASYQKKPAAKPAATPAPGARASAPKAQPATPTAQPPNLTTKRP